jgi:hypothetical protein
MIEHDLIAYLLTKTAITSIVGIKVYGNTAYQASVLPFILCRPTGGTRFYHTLGASGLTEATIEIICRAKTDVAAAAVYEAVRDSVDGFRGLWNGRSIDSAFLTPHATGTEDPTEGDTHGFPAMRGELNVFYQESLPTFGETI